MSIEDPFHTSITNWGQDVLDGSEPWVWALMILTGVVLLQHWTHPAGGEQDHHWTLSWATNTPNTSLYYNWLHASQSRIGSHLPLLIDIAHNLSDWTTLLFTFMLPSLNRSKGYKVASSGCPVARWEILVGSLHLIWFIEFQVSPSFSIEICLALRVVGWI